MKYIHNVEIIHRDLKADNVLINKDDIAKVADLGLAREIDIDNGMTLMAGTPKWEAPEVLAAKKGKRNYSKGADVYSYGMVLYEMVAGEDPFVDVHDLFELKKLVCDRHKRPKVPKHVPPMITSLMKQCWNRDPSKRPSFFQIHTYLTRAKSLTSWKKV
uniref:Protein kinase domain-containing protein n=1 Tax=Arcella intermedia TaxID=1963864 RepID=A0A6B2LMR1_9EUKA